ncbi:uncharacterized protein DKFZp434B061-like [Lepisosteus oculatus]|uniref:uncharacterized protein DKFZp434B061-like n=1 Tax=Lepisosteus oculatus TaxID=7918 RepID=UPI003715F013
MNCTMPSASVVGTNPGPPCRSHCLNPRRPETRHRGPGETQGRAEPWSWRAALALCVPGCSLAGLAAGPPPAPAREEQQQHQHRGQPPSRFAPARQVGAHLSPAPGQVRAHTFPATASRGYRARSLPDAEAAGPPACLRTSDHRPHGQPAPGRRAFTGGRTCLLPRSRLTALLARDRTETQPPSSSSSSRRAHTHARRLRHRLGPAAQLGSDRPPPSAGLLHGRPSRRGRAPPGSRGLSKAQRAVGTADRSSPPLHPNTAPRRASGLGSAPRRPGRQQRRRTIQRQRPRPAPPPPTFAAQARLSHWLTAAPLTRRHPPPLPPIGQAGLWNVSHMQIPFCAALGLLLVEAGAGGREGGGWNLTGVRNMQINRTALQGCGSLIG